MKSVLTTVFSIVLCFSQVNAQEQIPFIRSGVVIDSANSAYAAGQYEKSLNLLNTIPDADSNYVQAQLETMNNYLQLGNYEEAVFIGRKYVKEHTPLTATFYSNLATSLDYNGQFEEAVTVYEEGIEKYPYYRLLLYNYALTLYEHGRYEKSMPYFQEVLQIYPFHAASHYYLGQLMILQGHWSKAIMSLEMYLAISRTDNDVLIQLDNLVQTSLKEDGSIRPFTDNNFEETDDILKSLAALEYSFEYEVDFDASIVKQTELFLESLVYREDTDDFWMNFYVPFFTKIEKDGLSSAFTYYILHSSNKEKVNNWVEEHVTEVDSVISIAQDIIYSNRLGRRVTVFNSEDYYNFWYYENGQVYAIGNENSEGENIGPYEFYFANGQLLSEGRYDIHGNKIGNWTYYLQDGRIETIERFDNNGNLDGHYTNFHRNGQISSEYSYVEGIASGKVTSYYPCGAIRGNYNYKNDLLDGPAIEYYESGTKSAEYVYKKGNVEGVYKSFHPNGVLSQNFQYANDLKEGEAITYYSTGSKKEEGKYEQDAKEGIWNIYYENGTLSTVQMYHQDTITGPYKIYSSNGTLTETGIYNSSGNLDGVVTSFDLDGVKYSDIVYEDGKMVSCDFFNKAQQNISSQIVSQSDVIKDYDSQARLASERNVVDGIIRGASIVYYSSGEMKIKGTIEGDEYRGAYKEFHPSGDVKISMVIPDNGTPYYFQEFHRNGNVKEEGWLIDQLRDQEWRSYNFDGQLTSSSFYKYGDLDGPSYSFDSKGRVHEKEIYKHNELVNDTYFDTLGNVKYDIDLLDFTNKNFELYTAKGNRIYTVPLKCGKATGNVQMHFSSGIKASEGMRIDDIWQDSFVGYRSDGSKHFELNYELSEVHGTYRSFYHNGSIELESDYVFGESVGYQKTYYPNGQIESSCEYISDHKVGVCSYFDDKGNLMVEKKYDNNGEIESYRYLKSEGTYSKDHKIDPSHDAHVRAFYANGELSYTQAYKKGLLHGEYKKYNTKGVLIFEANLTYGDYHGDYVEYYANGDARHRISYKHDEKHGMEYYYWEDGKIQQMTNWKYGSQDGWSILYNRNGSTIYKTFYKNGHEY